MLDQTLRMQKDQEVQGLQDRHRQQQELNLLSVLDITNCFDCIDINV